MKTVGRYTVTGRLGRGGMSTVYKGAAPVTNRTVALKVLQPRDEIFVELVGEERLRQVFLEEASIMGEINHDHVAKILDCVEGHSPYIVLEYFAHSIGSLIGESYHVENANRVVSIKKVYRYIRQALLGLERLHFAGIIHRDIKPYNLMVTNDDRVKIIDFGLSRVHGGETMAIPGMHVGSPYYAAPEQERDPAAADERADIYSLGVVAYRMVTGTLPGVGDREIRKPSRINSELNDDWDSVLMRALARSADDRFASAEDMRHALDSVFARWQHQTEAACTFLAQDSVDPILRNSAPRRRPSFLKFRDAEKSLGLDGLMRPLRYLSHRFEYGDTAHFRCLDTATTWQREGSFFPLSWEKAQEYIGYLNRKKWQGRNNWRIPSTEELLTLLKPPSRLRDFCFESLISPEVHWVWSCDSATKKKAWIADLHESFFHPLDKDGAATVCAVSSDPV